MAQPTPTDVHIDAALSNISIAYKPENFMADQIFPIAPVDKESDYYYIWTKDFWFRDVVKRRTPNSDYAEGGVQISNTQFVCVNRGLRFPLPRETVQNQDAAINLEEAGAEWLAVQFGLHREIELAGVIFDQSAWTTDTTLSGGSQWSDYANSDPMGDINTGLQGVEKLTGIKPNVAFMGAEVFDKLKSHPDLLDRYKHTQVGILTEDLIAKLLGVDKLLVGRAVKNTAEEGATFSGSYVWDKNCLLMYVPTSPGLMVPSAGYSFIWRRQSGLPIEIKRVADDLRNRDVLQADQSFVQKVTGADLGYEIIDAVA